MVKNESLSPVSQANLVEHVMRQGKSFTPPIGGYLDMLLQLLRKQRYCVTDLNVVRTQMICLMITELRALHPHLVDTDDKIDMLE